MPRTKRGARAPKAKGRGRKKAEEHEEDIEQTDEDSQDVTLNEGDTSNDMETSQTSGDTGDNEGDSQENADDTAEDNEDQEGGQKRKAEENGEDEDDEEEQQTKSETKRAKTEPDPNRPVTLFCGNLDAELTADTLRGFFEMNGIDITNPRKIGYKRFGYVDVMPKDLEKALEINGKELNGEPITIEKSKPRTQEAQSAGGRIQGGDSKTLFVKGLKEDVTEEKLKEFFENAEEDVVITEIRLPKNREGTSKGFGYLVFSNEDALEKVMKDKQDAEIDGEKIYLDYTDEKSKGGKGNKEFGPSKVLFVRNLSFQVTEDELKELFQGCEACRIPPNDYGQSKGFGFVEFKTVEDAEAARKDKDGLEINGRVVQLAFASDKPQGASGGGRAHSGGFGGGGGGGFGWGRGGGGGRFGGGGGRGGGGWSGGGGGGWGGGQRRGGGGGGWGGGGGRGGGGWGGGGGRGGRGGGGGWGGYGGGGRGGRGGGGGGGGGFRKRW